MKKYVRVVLGIVMEIFSTDGNIAEMFHPDLIWVDITNLDQEPAYGWTAEQANGEWVFAPPAIPEPSIAELKSTALQQRDALLSEAAIRIAPLQDAIDLDEATDAEAASLKTWKQYRVLLSRIEKQSGYPKVIEWPIAPS